MQISSTAFEGIELLHVGKAVGLLGATYEEALRETASALVCNTANANREKITHALQWKIPAVRAEWLWDCIRQCEKLPFDQYLLCPHRQAQICDVQGLKRDSRSDNSAESEPQNKTSGNHPQRESKPTPKTNRPQKPDSLREGSTTGLAEAQDAVDSELLLNDEVSERSRLLSNRASKPSAPARPTGPSPLQERSPNISPRPSPPKPAASSLHAGKAPDSLNDAITSLLAHHRSHRSGSTASSATVSGSARTASAVNLDEIASALPNPARRKRKLLGRAPSNLSAHSAGERSLQHSPAKSLDSLHTDGLGTPIEVPSAPSRPATAKDQDVHDPAAVRTGRGKTPLLMSDDREADAEGEAAARVPVLTQVGYEDRDAQVWRASLMRKVGGRAVEESQDEEEEDVGSVAENRVRMMREDSGNGVGGIAKRTRRAGRA